MSKKKCFVVMGFGEKTDFEQQKKFDLDKTYRIIIKRAVEAAGLECIRADDVMHAGIIDKPMYELLLTADLVVADLSTANANAIYELGVRHALCPNTTIVIAEKGFKFPFDINSLLIRKYEHLGSGIDAEEAEAFRDALTQAICHLMPENEVDSPVYTFLPGLQEPITKSEPATAEAAVQARDAPDSDRTVAAMMELYRTAREQESWAGMKFALGQVRQVMPGDPFILQQLALATYKEKRDDPIVALNEAKAVLEELHPDTSRDPETLGLWGAVHKRLWELAGERVDLEASVAAYGRGFHLKDDYYNGINYAFMLDTRASVSTSEDAIADRVWARRVRYRVIEDCEQQLQGEIKDDEGNPDPSARFWLRATLVEAYFGTGQSGQSEALMTVAVAEAPAEWMEGSLKEQLEKLAALQSVAV